MPRKATRISFDSSNVFRLDFGLDMTSKLTVKPNKLVRTGKITHPRKTTREISLLACRYQPPEHLYFAGDLREQSR
jgi:hypothetical protein